MMTKYKFKSWLENRIDEIADFGLDQTRVFKDIPDDNEPIKDLNVEYITKLLKRRNLGVKIPVQDGFVGEVQWGEDAGAIKAVFSPYRGLTVSIRKLVPSLIGENLWVCKRVFPVYNIYDHAPDSLIEELTDVIKETDENGINSPSNTYEDLESLAFKIAQKLKTESTQKVLQYHGIRLIKENEKYIISFNCTGMGRQRQDQKRLDQFQVHMTYHKSEGFLRITGDELGDKIGQHRWQYDPSQFDEVFVPTQPTEEIAEAILQLFNSY